MTADIHERIIARLEDLRAHSRCLRSHQFPDDVSYPPLEKAFDMAIEDVRRKCPNCGDVGSCEHLHPPLDPKGTITVKCYCDRPAYLEECERRLNG